MTALQKASTKRTIVIGDLHGCRRTFDRLLDHLAYDARCDVLWLVGDLVNRGPDSLGCLARARELKAHVVLGNHDLGLLAVYAGVAEPRTGDTWSQVLNAPDRDSWIDWLRHQPLAIDQWIGGRQVVMTHAGVPPTWSLDDLRCRAREVEQALQQDNWRQFMAQLYGNQPARFDESLQGVDRLRAIINALTRMRFIAADGTLEFNTKQAAMSAPSGYAPWFCFPRNDNLQLVFGHWAALQGRATNAAIDVIATDGGCVWGNDLMAVIMETGQRIAVASELSAA